MLSTIGLFTFHGQFVNSFVSKGGVALFNEFTGPTTITKRIGDYDYTVTLINFADPGSTNATQVGSMSTHVGAVVHTVDITKAPEPSTLVLAGLGLPFLGLVWPRRWNPRGSPPPGE